MSRVMPRRCRPAPGHHGTPTGRWRCRVPLSSRARERGAQQAMQRRPPLRIWATNCRRWGARRRPRWSTRGGPTAAPARTVPSGPSWWRFRPRPSRNIRAWCAVRWCRPSWRTPAAPRRGRRSRSTPTKCATRPLSSCGPSRPAPSPSRVCTAANRGRCRCRRRRSPGIFSGRTFTSARGPNGRAGTSRISLCTCSFSFTSCPSRLCRWC
mmetsp:Transcript_10948/g.21668  ORF Transcript_10948/g.21668 Transcript_10948/m.21668 type:complete len:210 (-) Transcript_10948:890-1519(-)